MNVGNRMTRNPITVSQNTSLSVARDIMKKEKIHRLPVVDKKGRVEGMITEKDILYASPSPCTSLDVYEIHTLFAKLTVEQAMTRDVITVPADTPLEEAAGIMAENNIGGLPVTEKGVLVGIITESDIFKIFVEFFSIRQQGLRVTALLPEQKGELAALSRAIFENGGNIISFGSVRGDNVTNTLAIFKVQDMSKDDLVKCITPFVQEIRDIRIIEGV